MKKKKKERRIKALKRLQDQLLSGEKTIKRSETITVPLTETDKRRIREEIKILKAKIHRS